MKGPNKHRLTFLVLAIALIILVSVSAIIFTPMQTTGQVAKGASLVWEKTFGGTGDDRAFYATTTPDGNGYLIVGSSASFGQNKTVACMVKLDSEGNQLWNRTFLHDNGAEFRYAKNVSDGFLLVGNIFLSSGGTNGFILKVDTQGNQVWNITVNPAKSAGVNKLFSAADDGDNLVVAGLAESLSGNTSSKVWVIKIDANGNVIWNQTYGGAANYAGRSIAITQEGNYLVAGYTDQDANKDYDYLVLKLDASGNQLWNQTYGGAESDKAYAITATSDGCIIAGDTRSQGAGDADAWIIKLDLNGEAIWNKTLGGSDFDSPTYLNSVKDGSCIVAGTTFSFGNGLRDFWLFKLSSAGEVILNCTVGRSNYEEAYIVLPVGNNNYIMAGWTKSIGEGHYDYYIVKLRC